MPSTTFGKAYLVGAGPGDPELLTLKAKRILGEADVVLYDYLADKRILSFCAADAELIYVGKSGLTGHHMTQDETEQLIVERCKAGQMVCRLKGGDPYIFGRGGEEGQTLRGQGIAFEVVPGITSAIAAPAYAGIPVTHRETASSVAIITGHEDPTKTTSQIDWPLLGKWPGTLVFLMGIKQLPAITAQLLENGKTPDTPIALVRWGTRPEQETLTGTLETIQTLLEERPMLPPCVIVVGDVVRLRQELNWFETLPLFGKRIVITRARAQASTLRHQLEQRGAEVLEFPTIAIEAPEEMTTVDTAIHNIPQQDWVIFTSPNGVTHSMAALWRLGYDARHFNLMPVSRPLAPLPLNALKQHGLKADLVPETFVSEAIFEALKANLGDLSNQRLLLLRADIARDDLRSQLQQAGATVEDVAVYCTVSATEGQDIDDLLSRLAERTVDVITFSSSSTVANFVARLKPYLDEDESLLDSVRLASIGPITSQTLYELLGRVDIEATVYTIPGLIDAIETFYLSPTESEQAENRRQTLSFEASK